MPHTRDLKTFEVVHAPLVPGHGGFAAGVARLMNAGFALHGPPFFYLQGRDLFAAQSLTSPTRRKTTPKARKKRA